MENGPIRRSLAKALLNQGDWQGYVIIDGALFQDLPGLLAERAEAHQCLFSGDLDAEVRAVAPYIVRISDEFATLDWVVDQLFDPNGLLFIMTPKSIMDIRRHLRKMALAEMPDGQVVFFRYYDPRTILSIAQLAGDEQEKLLFGRDRDVIYHLISDGELVTFSKA